LATRLAENGHDAAGRTVWLWGGVTGYLPREALRATLDVVAARSAAGSTLAATYSPAAQVHGALAPAPAAGFGVLGEPVVGAIDPDEMRDELERRGFVITSDDDGVDWRARYGGRRVRFAPFAAERLVVATTH